MTTKTQVQQSIIDQGMLPLFFHPSADVSVDVTRALYKAGIRVIEYTNRGEAALENFKQLKKLQEAELPDLKLGIGTIKTAYQANEYVEVGADFIISPIVNAEVAAVAIKNNLMWIPGCMTPTEIHFGQQYGADMVKLFPANVLGPGFVSAVKDLFPGLAMMPTGGVEMDQENLKSWFKAGVAAVGMGSKLITKSILDNKDYDLLHRETLRAIQLVQATK